MSKLKAAWFDFACCEGCQVEMSNFGEPFAQLLEHIEPVEFREIMTETTTDPIDIAFIEGSFTREVDRARLEQIRERAAIVVAYGSCATSGGINALKNHMPQETCSKQVYGEDCNMPHLQSQAALPISAVIKVDYQIRGCPISRDEFVHVVSQLLHGTKKVYIPAYPVCMECKRNGTVCRFDDGDYCLGMVARAGCGAPCPDDGIPCEACRGLIDEPNTDALVKVLQDRGRLSAARAKDKSRMFTANFRSETACLQQM